MKIRVKKKNHRVLRQLNCFDKINEEKCILIIKGFNNKVDKID